MKNPETFSVNTHEGSFVISTIGKLLKIVKVVLVLGSEYEKASWFVPLPMHPPKSLVFM